MNMIHDPQYLVWSNADRLYKLSQQKIAQWVFKDNKDLRKQIKLKKSDIKDYYLTITQSSALWVKKSDMQQRIAEWKLQGILYDWKTYYHRQDIANCM